MTFFESKVPLDPSKDISRRPRLDRAVPGWILWVLLGVVGIPFVYFLFTPSSPMEQLANWCRYEAKGETQQRVRLHLKVPSSARFGAAQATFYSGGSSADTDPTTREQPRCRIEGNVEAQNLFGVFIPDHYSVAWRFNGHSWIETDFRMGE
jgi:hypothetical protein